MDLENKKAEWQQMSGVKVGEETARRQTEAAEAVYEGVQREEAGRLSDPAAEVSVYAPHRSLLDVLFSPIVL